MSGQTWGDVGRLRETSAWLVSRTAASRGPVADYEQAIAALNAALEGSDLPRHFDSCAGELDALLDRLQVDDQVLGAYADALEWADAQVAGFAGFPPGLQADLGLALADHIAGDAQWLLTAEEVAGRVVGEHVAAGLGAWAGRAPSRRDGEELAGLLGLVDAHGDNEAFQAAVLQAMGSDQVMEIAYADTVRHRDVAHAGAFGAMLAAASQDGRLPGGHHQRLLAPQHHDEAQTPVGPWEFQTVVALVADHDGWDSELLGAIGAAAVTDDWRMLPPWAQPGQAPLSQPPGSAGTSGQVRILEAVAGDGQAAWRLVGDGEAMQAMLGRAYPDEGEAAGAVVRAGALDHPLAQGWFDHAVGRRRVADVAWGLLAAGGSADRLQAHTAPALADAITPWMGEIGRLEADALTPQHFDQPESARLVVRDFVANVAAHDAGVSRLLAANATYARLAVHDNAAGIINSRLIQPHDVPIELNGLATMLHSGVGKARDDYEAAFDAVVYSLATSAAVTGVARVGPKMAGLGGPVAFMAGVAAGEALTEVQGHLEDELGGGPLTRTEAARALTTDDAVDQLVGVVEDGFDAMPEHERAAYLEEQEKVWEGEPTSDYLERDRIRFAIETGLDPRSDDPHAQLETELGVEQPGWFERAWDRVTPWDGSPAMEPPRPGSGRGQQG